MIRSRNLLLTLLLAATAALAQEKKAELATAPTPPVQPAVPPAVFAWGGDLRLRNEYYDNITTLTDKTAYHEQDFFRFRARLSATYTPFSDLVLSARLAAEPRYWVRHSVVKQHIGKGTEWRYLIADSLNAKWTTKVADMPVTVTIGRQDILFSEAGSAWLVYDGTPSEGSWTLFFDAARVTVNAKSIKTQFDAIFLNQQSSPKDHLPILGYTCTYALSEQDEKGVILYASNKAVKNTQIDGYFIYKNDTPVPTTGDDGEIYTIGSKLSGTPFANWAYSVEGAYQWGKKLDRGIKYPIATPTVRDLDGRGVVAKLTYLFKDKLNNTVSLIGEYLSGDKASTNGKDEMFDVLWGRYPRWSEVGAAAFSPETGSRNAQHNNIIRIGPNWTFAPIKGMAASVTYNALYAPEEEPTRATNLKYFSQSGHFRGNYFQVSVKQTFSKQLSATLYGEEVFMGDYYASRERLTFARAEIMYSF